MSYPARAEGLVTIDTIRFSVPRCTYLGALVHTYVGAIMPLGVYVTYLQIFTNPSAWAKCDTRSILKRSLTGLNSVIYFSLTGCLTRAKEPSLPYIYGERIIGFIPFSRVFVLFEMKSASSRVWTRVVVSISYDDNHYATGTSKLNLYLCICISVQAYLEGRVWA